jgi:glutamine synthetase
MPEKKFYALNNPVAVLLNKSTEAFRRKDFLKLIELKQLEKITFHYIALDGKLKELKIPIAEPGQVEAILAEGERVDGSSLYKGLVDMGLSDLYVVPVYRTAFFNPFDDKSLDFICRYLDKDGHPIHFALDNILARAHQLFKQHSGLELRALGELEFFLLSDNDKNLYPAPKQRGYHSSSPFVKTGYVLDEMVRHITRITGSVKYAHSEAGYLENVQSEQEEINGKKAEQMEIEFLPEPVEQIADHLVLARWLIRNVAYKHGMVAIFTPKIEEGIAGNGFHFHLELVRGGNNIITGSDGRLSQEAMRLIGGLCKYADSLTAFGNTVASSYLRLVPDLEAPTRVCWSDLNRSAMIRVPLGWTNIRNLAGVVNPGEEDFSRSESRQTLELRTPDGSALIHLLLAGIVMSADWAFPQEAATDKEALGLARKLYVRGNIFKDKKLLESLPKLPASCVASARVLREKRDLYERDGVFPSSIIDYTARMLDEEDDEFLQSKLESLPENERQALARKIMHKDLHKH